jgi:pyridoxal phosphate enzyme (YggS family)
MTNLSHKLQQTLQRIAEAAKNSNRCPMDITLVAVSKAQPLADIKEAYQAGQRHFGENYAQELAEKSEALKELDLVWHFIGPLQSNKTAIIAQHCQWVHSIDRIKIAQRLNDQRPRHLPPLQVCIQVNIHGEATKSGISIQELPTTIEAIKSMPNLQLRGLMTIPNANNPLSEFLELASLAKSFELSTLSMGMSNDLEEAVATGSTIVRIGTAIFGARSTPSDLTVQQ